MRFNLKELRLQINREIEEISSFLNDNSGLISSISLSLFIYTIIVGIEQFGIEISFPGGTLRKVTENGTLFSDYFLSNLEVYSIMFLVFLSILFCYRTVKIFLFTPKNLGFVTFIFAILIFLITVGFVVWILCLYGIYEPFVIPI